MQDNSSIIQATWLAGGWDYQQRVPDPSQFGASASLEYLFDPNNQQDYNAFTHLLNGIYRTDVESQRFEDPFATAFKRDRLGYGVSMRHIALDYAESREYRPDSHQLLKYKESRYKEWFTTLNRRAVYDTSIAREELRQAFFGGDEYGFNDLIRAKFDSLYNGDNTEEMLYCMNMLAEAHARKGFFMHKISELGTEESAKELLREIKAYARLLDFPTVMFNQLELPVFERDKTRLVLFVTPWVWSHLEVDALASVFHLDKAETRDLRIFMLPYIPIPNVQAILTTKDVLEMRDFEYGMYEFFDIDGLKTQIRLHHQSLIGFNPFAPVICFTTGEGTETVTATFTPTGVTCTAESEEIEIGGEVKLTTVLNGSWTNNEGRLTNEPDSVLYTIVSADFETTKKTFVDRYGTLHLQPEGVKAGDTLTISGKSTYINPSGETVEFEIDEKTFTVIEPVPHETNQLDDGSKASYDTGEEPQPVNP